MITEVLQELENFGINKEKKARMMFDYKECVQDINAWKAHLLRSINQEEAKQDVLDQLNEESCLIVMDWAMKLLSHHFQKQMSRFFGKHGRSWQVSAVITKSTAEKFKVECFVHLFNTCNQNSFAITSIIEHLLKTLKEEYPTLKQCFLCSENAGCYKNRALLLSLPEVSARSGIKVVHYDFSDPQASREFIYRVQLYVQYRKVNEESFLRRDFGKKNKVRITNLVNNSALKINNESWDFPYLVC